MRRKWSNAKERQTNLKHGSENPFRQTYSGRQKNNIEDVFLSGIKISEAQIVDSLIPYLQEKVINVKLVQKQTDAGEKSRFKAIVAVGNRDGYIGSGSGKASEVKNAIEKAGANARLNINSSKTGMWKLGVRLRKKPIVRFQVEGKCGGARVAIVGDQQA